MVGALDPFEQFADVVEAEAGPEAAETAGLDPKRSALRGGTSRHQAVPQRFIHDVAKGAPRSASRGLQLRRDVVIKRQRRPHTVMLVVRHHDVKDGIRSALAVILWIHENTRWFGVMNTLDHFRLDGQCALVTGGSRGLGRCMALALADAGADIVITGRTQDTLDATAAEIAGRGRRALTVRADMAHPAECEATCRTILDQHGPLDILINNVGNRIGSRPIVEETTDSWREVMDLNLTSCAVATRIFGQAMIARAARGRIINIASISALVANRGIGGRGYETAKAAVLHFTRCAAVDWAPHGVTVNAICPGLFMTDANREWNDRRPDVIAEFVRHVPMGRPGEPQEIGPLALYLASPASAYVTGAAFVIDGGYTAW